MSTKFTLWCTSLRSQGAWCTLATFGCTFPHNCESRYYIQMKFQFLMAQHIKYSFKDIHFIKCVDLPYQQLRTFKKVPKVTMRGPHACGGWRSSLRSLRSQGAWCTFAKFACTCPTSACQAKPSTRVQENPNRSSPWPSTSQWSYSSHMFHEMHHSDFSNLVKSSKGVQKTCLGSGEDNVVRSAIGRSTPFALLRWLGAVGGAGLLLARRFR
jgi:hypothetical protein